jgi:hypothetical protein
LPAFTFSIASPGEILGPANDDRIKTKPTTHANRIGNRDFFIAAPIYTLPAAGKPRRRS